MVPKPSSLDNVEERQIDGFVVDSDINCYDDTRLKQELRIAAEHCQILAEKLCRNDLSPARKARMSTSLDRCSSSSDGECCQEQRLKMKAIVAENIRLRQVLKDVTEINKRWQKYNTQQQDYVQRLQETIEVLQNGHDLPTRPSLGHVPFRQDEDRAKLTLLEHSQTLSSLKKSYEKAVKENCRLEKLVDELRSALSSKEQGNASEEKSQDFTNDSELRYAKEQAEVLRMQARVHREDWEAEKAEKEEAKRKLARAEDDIKDLTSKCHVFESQLQRIQAATLATLDGCGKKKVDLWDVPARPLSDPVEWTSKPQKEQMRSFQYGPQLRVLSRGATKRSPEEPSKQEPVDYNVKIDLTKPPCSIRTANSPSSFPQRTRPPSDLLTYHVLSRQSNSLDMVDDWSKDVVSCPSCGQQFSTSEHLRFLDHFEECQKTDRTATECLVSFN